MTEPSELWTRERWAAVATYAELVEEILSTAIQNLETEVRAWDGSDDPESKGIDPSENVFLAPYHAELKHCIGEMRRVIALFDNIPELPTSDKLIRDSEGKPVASVPRFKK